MDTRRAEKAKRRWWVSWWCAADDERPINDPPSEKAVLGWWVTGERSDGAQSICALVLAENEEGVRGVLSADWPELGYNGEEWRFLEPKEAGWVPGSRFVIVPWMWKRNAETSDV